jgi:hypothetical protein
MNIRLTNLLAPVAYLLLATSANADNFKYEVGLQGVALLGDGVPANDIIGFGVTGRYYLEDGWFVAGAIESYDYDFERPIEVVGLRQDPAIKTIDAAISTTVVSAHLGKTQTLGRSDFEWFWSLGIGAAFPDADSATGPTDDGGTFNVTTDAGTEIHLLSAIGLEYRFTPALSVRAAARAEHHFIDLSVTDQVSGATGTVDSHSPLGMNVGVAWRF